MAKSVKSLSASLIAGSDVIYEWYCEPCSSEDLHLEAAAYCEQCEEYLCENCCRYHRKSAALKHHKILEGKHLPKRTIVPKVRDVLTETCPKHKQKVLEYFCNEHGELCCSACTNTSHKACKDMAYIPDVSNGTATSPEYQDLASQLDRLVAKATHEQMRFELNDKDNDAYRDRAVANINASRKEMHKLMDKIAENAIEDVTKLHKENAGKIKSATQKCQSVHTVTNTLATDLGDKAKTRKNNQLFVDLKLTRHRIPAIENDILDITGKTITRFTFDQESKVKEMVSALSAIWSLSTGEDGTVTKARFLREVTAKADKDKKKCTINGVVIVPRDRLVVTDINNLAVKLIDILRNKVISRITTSSMPFAVTVMNIDEVAVSLGSERKIEIINVANGLTKVRTIDVPGNVFVGLCFDDQKFIIVCDLARAINAVDMSGNVSTVFTDSDSNQQFKKPARIVVGRHKSPVYYITDKDANTVTCMTTGGQVISTYRHGDLNCPMGVTTGRDGTVYVCSRRSHTVHQLSATGQHINVVLDEQQGLSEWPTAIAYDAVEERLCISNAGTLPKYSDFVRLYQLEYVNVCK